ncbi:MAG TPA: GAF domain-containing protein [Bryobacteraceae bacterium]|jgi:GAF domain-containing protein|nr:GAF domain-containing protein [Bryobacteraceae bacterium]
MQSSTRAETPGTKGVFYRQLCEQLDQLLGNEKSFVANAANTSALLFQLLPDVSWVGFYVAEGDELVLGPFQGKPACVRIPFGEGVCGTAAAEGRTIVVPDVDQFAGYISCDTGVQSEIVVPLINWGNTVGVLDIDSASMNRFDEEDKDGLESIAAVFLASQSRDDAPDFDEDIEVE